jgi:hypothetical protein
VNKCRRNRQRRSVTLKRKWDDLKNYIERVLFESISGLAKGEMNTYEKRAELIEQTLLTLRTYVPSPIPTEYIVLDVTIGDVVDVKPAS